MTGRILATILLLSAALGSAAPVQAATAGPDTPAIFGVWRNPKNSVHVEIRRCGEAACGYVVWASAKAKADSLEGSGKELVGMELLHDLSKTDSGSWKGKVFVPDLNITLTGIAKPIDANQLEAKGCVLGRLICKGQTWTRVAAGQ
ncbi:MAG: DUF2147 domain-containing protein [Phenylobacterium sp.]|uniref:DUF2147 domain-containing protein n=1 Tax=Phenylobacterium sp. TaxID=1871053 RepID=UPI0025F59DBA|nr:DUF2147 domain-containing protein [Phenylobacterium sp.]MBI1199812.1 DUF2147 domain-containing protein [Phenylobacterium sp.]